MKSKKNKIIIAMCIAVLLMATGYAILSTRLTIKGTSSITDTWEVKITNITSTATGTAYNISEPTYTDTSMNFKVGVKAPGDKMTFTITVQNFGTLGAILDKIDATSSGSAVVKHTINGIEEKTRLAAGDMVTFTVTTEFDINATFVPTGDIKELTIDLVYIQDDGQTLTPITPNIEGELGSFATTVLNNNRVKSDEGIDFALSSLDDGISGLYYTNTNTENNKTTYYFRGNVNNNYVKFSTDGNGNDIIWRIVRINEDGSIRLITQDSIANLMYSEEFDNAYVGYMYGIAGSLNYSDSHNNSTDSIIKEYLDVWYEEHIDGFDYLIADSGFCNDRSVAPSAGLWAEDDTALGYGENSTYYGAYNRLGNNHQPQFACPQTNDLYTTTSSNKGNKKLIYPIGLLTADEISYAGGADATSSNYYLDNNSEWWSMSPITYGTIYGVVSGGALVDRDCDGERGVRPVINLKASVEYESGNGTYDSPYTIVID